jgi:TP901 family phage tail tape measure protein
VSEVSAGTISVLLDGDATGLEKTFAAAEKGGADLATLLAAVGERITQGLAEPLDKAATASLKATEKMAVGFGDVVAGLDLLTEAGQQTEAKLTAGFAGVQESLEKMSAMGVASTMQLDKSLGVLSGNLGTVAGRMARVAVASQATYAATKELKAGVDETNSSLHRIEQGVLGSQEALGKMLPALDRVIAGLDRLGKKSEQTGQKVQQSLADRLDHVGQRVSNVGMQLSMGITAPLTALGGFSLKAAMDLETSMAMVSKTLRGSDEEVAAFSATLKDTFKTMSTEIPTSAADLGQIAALASQLGVKKENLVAFTRAMADMGVATNLNAQDAATELARFANITQMSQNDFGRLGSSIVALGNNFATTESDIVAMGMRLAGAGHVVGLNESQIMGLSAALSSVGVEAEAGGTAFSRVMMEIANAVAEGKGSLTNFAQVAGMPRAEFAKLAKEHPEKALLAFVGGLDRLNKSGVNVFAVLKSVEFQDARVRDALLRSAGAGDLMTRALETSSRAWEENTALNKEAERFYGTTENQLKMLWNEITNVASQLGETLIPALRKLFTEIRPILGMFSAWVETFANLHPILQLLIIGFAAFLATLGPLLFMLGQVIQTVAALTAVITVLKGEAALAGLASLLTPAGLIIGGLALLAGAFMYVSYKAQQAAAATAAAIASFRASLAGMNAEQLMAGVTGRMALEDDINLAKQVLQQQLTAARNKLKTSQDSDTQAANSRPAQMRDMPYESRATREAAAEVARLEAQQTALNEQYATTEREIRDMTTQYNILDRQRRDAQKAAEDAAAALANGAGFTPTQTEDEAKKAEHAREQGIKRQLDLMDVEVQQGRKTLQDRLNFLNQIIGQEQAAHRTNTDFYVSMLQEQAQTEQQIRDQTFQRNMQRMELEVSAGQKGAQDRLALIQQAIAQEEQAQRTNTDFYLQLKQQEMTALRQIRDEERSWAQFRLQTGQLTYKARVAQIDSELQHVRAGSQEQLQLEQERFNVLSEYLSRRTQEINRAAGENKALALQMLNQLMAEMQAIAPGIEIFRQQITDAMDQVRTKGQQSANQLHQAFQSVAEQVIGGIVDGLIEGRKNWGDWAKQMLADIAKMIIKLLVMKAIMKALKMDQQGGGGGGGGIFGALGTVVGLAIGGPGGAAAGGAIGGAIDGFAAKGANMTAGEAWIVGEKGPELFFPGVSGQVKPVDVVDPGAALTQAQPSSQPAVVFDFSGMPGPKDMRQAARDAEWQDYIRETLRVAKSQGFKV